MMMMTMIVFFIAGHLEQDGTALWADACLITLTLIRLYCDEMHMKSLIKPGTLQSQQQHFIRLWSDHTPLNAIYRLPSLDHLVDLVLEYEQIQWGLFWVKTYGGAVHVSLNTIISQTLNVS